MFTHRLARFIALLFLVLGAPALAARDSGVRTTSFDTAFTPQYDVGAYAGQLKLTIAPDGTISGFYRDVDSGSFKPVTGGLSGDRIYLDFGFMGGTHVTGTYDGTKITGGALVRGRIYDFSASVEPN